MALKITQESFNATVMENMELFESNLEEGIKDTIEQFKAQVTFCFFML